MIEGLSRSLYWYGCCVKDAFGLNVQAGLGGCTHSNLLRAGKVHVPSTRQTCKYTNWCVWLPDWGLSNSLYNLENIVVKATDFPAWLLSPLYCCPQHTADRLCVSAEENFLFSPSSDCEAVAVAAGRGHAFRVTVRQEATAPRHVKAW